MFFGLLVPLILKSKEALVLPLSYALGTGIPVILFSFLIAFGANKISTVFSKISQIEKVIRKVVATVFIIVGIYYLRYLLSI